MGTMTSVAAMGTMTSVAAMASMRTMTTVRTMGGRSHRAALLSQGEVGALVRVILGLLRDGSLRTTQHRRGISGKGGQPGKVPASFFLIRIALVLRHASISASSNHTKTETMLARVRAFVRVRVLRPDRVTKIVTWRQRKGSPHVGGPSRTVRPNA